MSAPTIPETISELLWWRVRTTPDAVACRSRRGTQGWTGTSWGELGQRVRRQAAALRRLGLRKGDRLAILGRTCQEWYTAELAGLCAGAVIVGIDAHAGQAQAEFVLRHSGACGLIADRLDNLEKLPASVRAELRFVAVWDEPAGTPAEPHLVRWSELLSPSGGDDDTREPPAADDPATLIYTAGTTGTPKGIEYTHRQVMVACRATLEAYPQFTAGGETTLCWLPMAHLFQRVINLGTMACALTTYFAEDPREIAECLRDAQPGFFAAVPRFYEKLHAGIEERRAQARGMRRWLLDSALGVSAEWSRCLREGRAPGWWLSLRHAALDRLVLSRIRRVMGGKVRVLLTGSAPIAPWLLEYFHALGLLVLEAYGLSENTVPVAANRPDAYRFGSVGKPFPRSEVRLANDGEILVRSAGLFRGYYKEGPAPDQFTADGFYRTGDVGRFDEDGYLYLVGRIAEIIKTSTGRRIAPARVEAAYGRSRYVEHVVVFGDGLKQLVGLVTLNRAAVAAALAETGVTVAPAEDLADSPRVEELIGGEIERLGRDLAPHEQVRAFAILPGPLTVAGGELTSTLKLRRNQITARYGDLLRRLAAEPGSVQGLTSPGPATA